MSFVDRMAYYLCTKYC